MSHPASVDTRGAPLLWFAVVGGPAAWLVGLVGSYFWIHNVCEHQSAVAPRLISLVTFAVALAAGISGWLIAARLGLGASSKDDSLADRTRFMAQIGALSGLVFALILLLQILATLMLDPCQSGGGARTRHSPDVWSPQRGTRIETHA